MKNKIENWIMRNKLPLTPREKQMIKWFVKFELSIILLIVAWIVPFFAAIKHYDNYQTLLQQVHVLQSREAHAEVEVKNEKTTVEDRAGTVGKVDIKEQIKQIAEDHNFEWVDYLLRLAECESHFDQYADNQTNSSNDRGVFQISKKWHPEVSDECAYDINCSTKWTMWMIESGHQSQWACNSIILNI